MTSHRQQHEHPYDQGHPTTGRLIDKTYHYPVRVYYEDTDQQGIVFYANYLKFLERARTEFLRHLGAPPARLEAELERLFVVAHLDMRYRASARLDEVLDVQTSLRGLGRVRLVMDQHISRAQTAICTAQLTLAIVDRTGRPARLTPALEARFQALL